MNCIFQVACQKRNLVVYDEPDAHHQQRILGVILEQVLFERLAEANGIPFVCTLLLVVADIRVVQS